MHSVVKFVNGTSAGGNRELNSTVCYAVDSDELYWNGYNTLENVMDNLALQMICVVLVTRLVALLLKPFRQPRVVAEILGGIILGPSVLGNWNRFVDQIFPDRSINVLESVGNLGLMYFMFIVGVQMDLVLIKKVGRKAVIFAIFSMTVPLVLGLILIQQPGENPENSNKQFGVKLFYGVMFGFTSFPGLTRLLAELKLLTTQLGQMAMTCALLTDVFSWILLTVVIGVSVGANAYETAVGLAFAHILFFSFCFFIVRPSVNWIIRHTEKTDTSKDVYLCTVLIGLNLTCIITDKVGIPPPFGAFIYGLVIPIGPFGAALVDILEDFVFAILMPLFFTNVGLSIDLKFLVSVKTAEWAWLVFVIISTCVARVGTTLLLAIRYQMPLDEGVALGLLMNTKGTTEIAAINIGRVLGIINAQAFAIIITVSLATTCLVTPMVSLIYKPIKRHLPSFGRTIQGAKGKVELRFLACMQTLRNVPATINLLETLGHSKRHPIYVYALHLMELNERESSMLIVHNAHKFTGGAVNHTQAQSDHIINAIKDYKKNGGILPIQPVTSISPFPTMHEDICNVAEERQANFIILPFHKYQTIDGDMECIHTAHRTINQNVLVNAPCSVGILIDRGFGSSKRVEGSQISHHVIVLFFGGPDDREALSFALRMVEDPSISLTILRFLSGEESTECKLVQNESPDESVLTISTADHKEKQADDEFLNKIAKDTVNNAHISFMDKIVNNGAETVNVLRSIDEVHDLYIVGRGAGMSSLTADLIDWSEFPELGVFGDILASSDFALTASVLVVHQFVGMGLHDHGLETPDSSHSGNEFYVGMDNINSTIPPAPQR